MENFLRHLTFIVSIIIVTAIAGSSGDCTSISHCMTKLEQFVNSSKIHLDAFPLEFLPARCKEKRFRVQTINVTEIEKRFALKHLNIQIKDYYFLNNIIKYV